MINIRKKTKNTLYKYKFKGVVYLNKIYVCEKQILIVGDAYYNLNKILCFKSTKLVSNIKNAAIL